MVSFGVDIGGTGCKCAAFQKDGTQLALAYEEYPVVPGQVNLPPEILTASVFRVIAECANQLEDRNRVQVITVSSFGESFVAIDSDGDALTNILMYFGNSESEEFATLVKQIGERQFMEISKIFPDASYSLSKMLYTKRITSRPVWKFLFIAGFICYKLSGSVCTDESLACRSLLYDVKNRCWSQKLLNACDIDADTLPNVLPTGSLIGDILPDVAKQLNLPQNTKIVIGAHDQIVNALGAGVSNLGDAVDTSGTCECITPLYSNIPENQAFTQYNFACVPYLETQGYVTYAYNISAGSVVRWYRDAFARYLQTDAEYQGKSIYDLLNESCPTNPTNLIVLPFLQGMGGTPDVDANATGLIAGLTTQTRLPDIYRAILEGITFEMRYNQEKLKENGICFQKLYACGGGAKSSVWLQIKADILGCEIVPVLVEETGSMGSAILGFAAVTGENPFEIANSFWQYGNAIKPKPENQEIYNTCYETYKTLRCLHQTQRREQA